MGLQRESHKIEPEKEKEKKKSTEVKVPEKIVDINKPDEERKEGGETPTPTKPAETGAKLKDKFLNFLLEDEI